MAARRWSCWRLCRRSRGEAAWRLARGQGRPRRGGKRWRGRCGVSVLVAQSVAQEGVASSVLMLTRCVSCAIFATAWQGWQAWQQATIVAERKRSPFAAPSTHLFRVSAPACFVTPFWTQRRCGTFCLESSRRSGAKRATRRPRHTCGKSRSGSDVAGDRFPGVP